MKAQYITSEIDTANALLKKGWVVVDSKIAMSNRGEVDIRGLTPVGIAEAKSANAAQTARTIVLELENAERCGKYGTKCTGCYTCDYTCFVEKITN